MNHPQVKPAAYAALTVLTAILAVVCAYLVKKLDIFGSPFLFAFAILIELVLLITLVFCLLAALRRPLVVLGSILESALKGILTNQYIKRMQTSRSPVWLWL